MDTNLQGIIEQRDIAHLDPNERAEHILAIIGEHFGWTSVQDTVKNPHYWDLVCFSTEMLSTFAVSSGQDELMDLAKWISRRIYSLHYSVPPDHEILGPSWENHIGMFLMQAPSEEELQARRNYLANRRKASEPNQKSCDAIPLIAMAKNTKCILVANHTGEHDFHPVESSSTTDLDKD